MPDQISTELLRQLLRYDPQSGKLFWLPRRAELFTDGYRSAAGNCTQWNVRHAGKEAFTGNNGQGYRQGEIFGQRYYAQRVIMALVHGAWPAEEVDHIDGDPSNNRIANLREATRAENLHNRRAARAAKSKHMGVCFNTRRAKWVARLTLNGLTQNLGYFRCETAAALAYNRAAIAHHGKFARPNMAARAA